MDPLAEKYYSISPYVYCRNNPVNRIDPDGQDDYRLNRNGEIEFIKETDAETHTIFALNKKGNIDKNNSYQVEKYVLNTKETVSDVKASDSDGNVFSVSLDIYTSSGDASSTGLFNFLAKNSDVEWSHVKTTNGDADISYLITSKEIGVDAGIDFMSKRLSTQNSQNSMANFLMGSSGINVREGNHSHPNNTTTVSVGDINVANNLYSRFPNALMNISTPIDGVYTPFNRHSPTGALPEIEVVGRPLKRK